MTVKYAYQKVLRTHAYGPHADADHAKLSFWNSLRALAESGTADATVKDGFCVGSHTRNTYSGLVMVGDLVSIQQDLFLAGELPPIQSNEGGNLCAFWDTDWLMITSSWFLTNKTHACTYRNLVCYNITVMVTPAVLAEALKKMWPGFFKKD